MKTTSNKFEPTRERPVSFASVILAFSLFGFLWPHNVNTGKERSLVHFQMQKNSETQSNAADWDHDDDGFYKPTRSPGWNELFH